jgi:hypothetical protein
MLLQFRENVGGLLKTWWNCVGSERSSAGQEVEDEDDDGKDQKNMNPAAEGVAANQSYDP